MPQEIKLIDPSANDLAKAFDQVAGYPISNADHWHATERMVWKWLVGSVATGKGEDGKRVMISWEWDNGYVNVKVFKS